MPCIPSLIVYTHKTELHHFLMRLTLRAESLWWLAYTILPVVSKLLKYMWYRKIYWTFSCSKITTTPVPSWLSFGHSFFNFLNLLSVNTVTRGPGTYWKLMSFDTMHYIRTAFLGTEWQLLAWTLGAWASSESCFLTLAGLHDLPNLATVQFLFKWTVLKLGNIHV